MTYKRIEGKGFEWPRIQDGMIDMNKSQFEALFEGLDWKRVIQIQGQFTMMTLMFPRLIIVQCCCNNY